MVSCAPEAIGGKGQACKTGYKIAILTFFEAIGQIFMR
jgi:hypothetical protein